MLAAQVVVGTAATLLFTAPNGGGRLRVKNISTGALCVGPATVTMASGYELLGNETIDLDLWPGDSLFGIVASGTKKASVIVVGYPVAVGHA